MRSISRLVLLALIAVLAGCASGPKFNTVEAALSTVGKDQARVYIYRTATLGGAIQPEIKLNGAVVGKSVPQGVFYVDVAPGDIEVVTGSEVDKKLTFTIAAGESRYVRTSVGFGILVYRIYPELVSENEARNEIRDLAYTGTVPAKK